MTRLVSIEQLREFVQKECEGASPTDVFLENLVRNLEGQVLTLCRPRADMDAALFSRVPAKIFKDVLSISEKPRHIFAKCFSVTNSEIFRFAKVIEYASKPEAKAVFLWTEKIFGFEPNTAGPITIDAPVHDAVRTVISKNSLQEVFVSDLAIEIPKSKADQKIRWVELCADGRSFNRTKHLDPDKAAMPATTASDVLTFFTGEEIIYSASLNGLWILAGPSKAVVLSRGEKT